MQETDWTNERQAYNLWKGQIIQTVYSVGLSKLFIQTDYPNCLFKLFIRSVYSINTLYWSIVIQPLCNCIP